MLDILACFPVYLISKCKIGNSLGEMEEHQFPVTETTLSYYDKYYYEYGKEERLCLGAWNIVFFPP